VALHNLLDITLPTIVIIGGMYDDVRRSAQDRQGADNGTPHVNDQHNAPEPPRASILKYWWQLWAAIKSLWLGCPAESNICAAVTLQEP